MVGHHQITTSRLLLDLVFMIGPSADPAWLKHMKIKIYDNSEEDDDDDNESEDVNVVNCM